MGREATHDIVVIKQIKLEDIRPQRVGKLDTKIVKQAAKLKKNSGCQLDSSKITYVHLATLVAKLRKAGRIPPDITVMRRTEADGNMSMYLVRK